MTRITVVEAKALTVLQYHKSQEDRIQENLDKIYSKIGDAARKGQYRIELGYPNHVDKICTILKEDGYKVKTRLKRSFRDFDEYMIISWEVI